MNSTTEKTTSLTFYTPNLLYTLLNVKFSKSTIRINLELMPSHILIKLAPAPQRFIILPNNSSSHSIINNLNKT